MTIRVRCGSSLCATRQKWVQLQLDSCGSVVRVRSFVHVSLFLSFALSLRKSSLSPGLLILVSVVREPVVTTEQLISSGRDPLRSCFAANSCANSFAFERQEYAPEEAEFLVKFFVPFHLVSIGQNTVLESARNLQKSWKRKSFLCAEFPFVHERELVPLYLSKLPVRQSSNQICWDYVYRSKTGELCFFCACALSWIRWRKWKQLNAWKRRIATSGSAVAIKVLETNVSRSFLGVILLEQSACHSFCLGNAVVISQNCSGGFTDEGRAKKPSTDKNDDDTQWWRVTFTKLKILLTYDTHSPKILSIFYSLRLWSFFLSPSLPVFFLFVRVHWCWFTAD